MSHILALETSCELVYPTHPDGETARSRADGEFSLRSDELAPNASVTSYDVYAAAIEQSARSHLEAVI